MKASNSPLCARVESERPRVALEESWISSATGRMQQRTNFRVTRHASYTKRRALVRKERDPRHRTELFG